MRGRRGERPSACAWKATALKKVCTTLIFMSILWGLVFASSALAYDETTMGTGKSCDGCHGFESGSTTVTAPTSTRKGPHGGYTTGTQKCQTCHTLHDAYGSILLAAPTLADTCNSCHDGTGGKGVYGTLSARGVTPSAQHSIDATDVIPGGNAGGGSRTQTFTGQNGYLSCGDCHSPHDSETVTAFPGDRLRDSDDPRMADSGNFNTKYTNRLLRQQPTGSPYTITVYGSTWCGGCHQGRLASCGPTGTHSVETETAGFNYGNIVSVVGTRTTTTQMGPLGGSNYGFVMPLPRSGFQSGKKVICQQCHEDARHIGDNTSYPRQIDTTETFRVTTPDGTTASDNPRFQTFPHEGVNTNFTVEVADDLCLNCH